jgi:hypothetical protein
MGFIKGQSGNLKGKPKGSLNKNTKTVKEMFNTVFSDLQNDSKANLYQWAKDNPSDFYKLCSKLIPAAVEMKAELNEPIKQVFKIGNTVIEL